MLIYILILGKVTLKIYDRLKSELHRPRRQTGSPPVPIHTRCSYPTQSRARILADQRSVFDWIIEKGIVYTQQPKSIDWRGHDSLRHFTRSPEADGLIHSWIAISSRRPRCAIGGVIDGRGAAAKIKT